MKKTITLVIIAMITMTLGLGFTSCTKEKIATPTDQNQSAANMLKCGHPSPPPCHPTTPTSDCGTPTVVNLKAGNTTVGTVTVSNDANNLKVKYTTTGGWSLDEMSLYVGDIANIPRRNGAVNASQFSHQSNPNSSVQTYTFTIPLSSLPSCFSVAAEARVVRSRCTSEIAWGAGTTITIPRGSSCGSHNNCNNYYNCNNNDATYFSYCKEACTNATCLLAPSILFSGEAAWPGNVTQVTVGGYTYSQSDVSTEYTSPANDAQKALLLIVTLKLYAGSLTPPLSVTSNAAVVENWLSGLGQLNQYSNFTAPANVATALNAVSTYITSQTCSQ